MSYIDDNLVSGEHVVHRAALHWIVFTTPAIVALGGLVALAFRADHVFGYIVLLIAGFITFIEYVNVATSEFAVTNKRVIVSTGVITRSTRETFLHKIEGVSVHQGLLGLMLAYGTVSVHGTGNTNTEYARIRNPLEFRRHVQEQIEASHGAKA